MQNKIVIFLLSILFFTSCEKVIDVDIKSFEEALVVEGGIYHQKDGSSEVQRIRLSQTIDFLDQAGGTPISDAAIEVSDGNTSYNFQYTTDGYYTTNIPTEVGKTYELKITYDGQEITASETLLDVAVIDSIYTSFEEETTFTDAGYFVKINTRDLPGMENFYHWRLFIDDVFTIVPDPGNQANLIANDEFFDGQKIEGYKPNEEIILELGQTVRVEQLGISEGYYDFLYQVFGQTGSIPVVGNPPPAQIKGNLLNSTDEEKYVLGYFVVASVASAETLVSE